MLFGESAARMRFEVFLKRSSFFSRIKCNGGLNSPWSIFRGMSNLSLIVRPETCFKVLCQSSVVAASVCFTNEKINVMKCLAHRLLFQSFARLRFTELRRGQSSALPMACQGEVQKMLNFLNEDWRWGESNPRPPKRHNSFYVCSLPLRSRLRDCQQTGPSRTPATCWVSLLRPAARRRNYPAVVVFIPSAGVRGNTSSL